ncbi:MAG: DUF4214 domain-containing protein, partial [Actinomycetia bacterium]|nr:DUF4214 domain-containing protein [Actinomycetes bacterium]
MLYADPHPSRRRSSLATLALLLASSALLASFMTPASPAAEAAEVRPMTLPIHRNRIADMHWTDTFGAARSSGRSHIGVDMLGPKMVPLVAVKDATVSWGRFENERGSILRLRDDEGWEYQYIHLNNDTPGTDNGQALCTETFSARLCTFIDGDGDFPDGVRVTEGEVVAYLGDGGNAEWTASHLHFEIYKPSESGAQAINPTPSVDAARARALAGGETEDGPPAAEPGDAGFADHVWFRLHGRYPTTAERAAFAAEVGTSGVWQALAGEIDESSTASTVDRLYLAFFLRYPDSDGIQYWIRVRAAGYAVEEIAEWFAESEEYQARYAGTSFSQFLDQLYSDVLDRPSDESGKAYWLDLLERGVVTRGTIVVYFTESAEMKLVSVHRNEIVALSLVKDGTVPTEAEAESWRVMRSSQST